MSRICIITVRSWSYWCHVWLSTSLMYIVDHISVLYHSIHHYNIWLILLMSCMYHYLHHYSIYHRIDIPYQSLHLYSMHLIILMSCMTVYIISVYSWSYWCPVSLSALLQYIVDPTNVLYHCLHHYSIIIWHISLCTSLQSKVDAIDVMYHCLHHYSI